MTVIAWDGKTLAADKQATFGDHKTTVVKLERHGAMLLATTGDLSIGMEMLDWYKSGADPAKFPAANRSPDRGASLVCVMSHGDVWKYESSPHPFRIDAPFAAFGCGATAALVAMACGKTAREAVLLASEYVDGCGGGVDTLELEPA